MYVFITRSEVSKWRVGKSMGGEAYRKMLESISGGRYFRIGDLSSLHRLNRRARSSLRIRISASNARIRFWVTANSSSMDDEGPISLCEF